MKISALIFDFDGLIVDTETPAFLSWQEIYAEFGVQLSLQEWIVCLGTISTAFNAIADLEQKTRRHLDATTIWTKRQRRKGELTANQPVLPGVNSYLHTAQTLGLKIGLASSSPHTWVEGHLARLNLLHYFECLQCAEDVPEVKPHPALYTQALEQLGVSPDAALAFEDSPNGVAAAKAASLRCVAIPGPLCRNIPLKDADFLIPSLAAMPLPELLRHFTTS